VISVRHDRKSGGPAGDSGRGSSAYTGAVDIVLRLVRPDEGAKGTIRRLESVSRYPQTPEQLEIELTQTGYIALGSSAAARKEGIVTKLLTFLPEAAADPAEGVTVPELVGALAAGGCAVSRTSVQRDLDRLEKEEAVGRNGTGRRGAPFRYFRRCRAVSAQPSEEGLELGSNESFRPLEVLVTAPDSFLPNSLPGGDVLGSKLECGGGPSTAHQESWRMAEAMGFPRLVAADLVVGPGAATPPAERGSARTSYVAEAPQALEGVLGKREPSAAAG
jgi:hypothetical protein